ncbi:DMT family transporter [Notoacmeibacter sp. MSK16QG-6]|uniref:DMT family transporter n=1 Tax=Notoacmeibacter sp. MSK16QG-6 TaxID=2957982 RepID=UPI00209F3089|nr:DMT family transporter [Notoacmeibacter sp. MSK16QG-6]MCP1199754.1 DMT family transporter [Notoacmeibacter sp. MSK16QG-6]
MVGLASKAREDRLTLGIVLMLLAYATFSMVDTSAKWMGQAGLAALQIAFMRYAVHLVLTIGLIARGGLSFDRFASEKIGLVVLRALLLVGTSVTNFIAVRYLPLTLTATIAFSAPIIVCALSWPLLGERVGPWRWSAILIGFCGLLVAIRPFDATLHWAVFISLGTAFLMALYALLTRRLSGEVSPMTMQFYGGLVGTVVLAPFAFLFWQMPDRPMEWIMLFGIGLLGWAGHEVFVRAHRFAEAGVLTPFSYSFLIWMTFWSALLFNEYPDSFTIIGASIVSAAGLFIWARERWLQKARRIDFNR